MGRAVMLRDAQGPAALWAAQSPGQVGPPGWVPSPVLQELCEARLWHGCRDVLGQWWPACLVPLSSVLGSAGAPPTSLGEVRALDSEDIGVEGLQWPPAGPSVLAPCWPEGRGAEGLGNDNVSAGGVARRQCLFTPGGPQSLPGFLGCSWHPFLQPSGGPTPASVFPRVVPIVLLVTDSVGFTGGLDQWVKGPVQCMVGRGEGPKDPCACPPSRPQLLRACRPPLGPQPWPACEVCGLGHMTERGSG